MKIYNRKVIALVSAFVLSTGLVKAELKDPLTRDEKYLEYNN